MTIRNASIPVGATFSPSGGSATTIIPINSDSASLRAFVGSSGVTALDRTECIFTGKTPKVSSQAPGGFTQGRASVKIIVPKILATAKRTLNTGTIELSIDPETTTEEVDAMRSLLINFLNDTDFAQLWLNQSTN